MSSDGKNDVVCLFDGNSVFARAYYASKDNLLQDHVGRPIAGIDAGLKIVLSIIDRYGDKLGRVDQMLFCWDTAPKSQKPRPDKSPEYDDELVRFSQLLHDLLGASQAFPPAHEADDAVCTAAYRQSEQFPDQKIYVVSADKDLQQLKSGNIGYYCLNEKAVLSHAYITHRWKVKHPVQLAIALAIIGDPGDGIPGIRGWGPKKVEKLFSVVPDNCCFKTALELIEAQIPDELKSDFYKSLDLTLLDPEVPGVPMPAPLVFGSGDQLIDDFNLPGLHSFYQKIKLQYAGAAVSTLGPQDYIDE